VPAKRLQVRWLKRALANLEAEAGYIARDNPAAARRVVAAIQQTVDLLAAHPALGRPGRIEGTRELAIPNTPYIIPYRVREERVGALRVFHAARKSGPRNSQSTPATPETLGSSMSTLSPRVDHPRRCRLVSP
jgi:toxin ParE1/3/4